MSRFIAFYLPQFHPTPQNDEWWGKGFTEWKNVVKAKSLFRGHIQPQFPADLGFYDLRVPEVRVQQAELAKEAGIEAFCYWHYWFGKGRRLLERPFNEVLISGSPDFPFCLAWANHSWYKKLWDSKSKENDILLMEQTYPGIEDYIDHFNCLLPAFKDKRYLRVDGKLFFVIYNVDEFEDITTFIKTWRELASKNGLNDFYFVARDADSRRKDKFFNIGFDAIYNDDVINIHHRLSKVEKVWLYIQRKYLGRPTIFDYNKACEFMIIDDCRNKGVIPTIAPNWDHSPRSGTNAIILHHSNPDRFQKLAEKAIDIVSGKPTEEQIIMIRSWNEWAEGNFMEPRERYGKKYIIALHNAIEKHMNK